MRILYLHQHFVSRSGSGGGRSYEFGRYLVGQGHDVTIVTGAYHRGGMGDVSEKLVADTSLDGIRLITVRVPYDQGMSNAARIVSFAKFMFLASWTALRIEAVDIVFATSTPLTIAIPGILASASRCTPFVFEVRDLWPEVPIALGVLKNPFAKTAARWLERLAYRRAAHVVALSPGMRDGILQAGIAPEKVTVIPNASDVELLRVPPEVGRRFRAGHPEIGDRPLVVYAGALGKVNGLSWAVDLAKRVFEIDPRVCFLLVGEGSERDALEQYAKGAGVLGRNLFMMDALPRSELGALLSAADVVSSLFVPVGAMEANSANKFFDAFAAGKPIIINYGGWQADLLEDSGAGAVLDQKDMGSSAQRLVGMLSDPEWLAKASAASRRLGDERFHRQKLAAEFEDVLVRTLDRCC